MERIESCQDDDAYPKKLKIKSKSFEIKRKIIMIYDVQLNFTRAHVMGLIKIMP